MACTHAIKNAVSGGGSARREARLRVSEHTDKLSGASRPEGQ